MYKDSVQVFYGTRLIKEMPRVGSGEVLSLSQEISGTCIWMLRLDLSSLMGDSLAKIA
ncbi:MAG TPA: hypothetical protein PKZ32_22445 [Candidatus Melainabacteria bacterium]|nr:hypothetical protein [Candidatus Melainabacteria bacterium]